MIKNTRSDIDSSRQIREAIKTRKVNTIKLKQKRDTREINAKDSTTTHRARRHKYRIPIIQKSLSYIEFKSKPKVKNDAIYLGAILSFRTQIKTRIVKELNKIFKISFDETPRLNNIINTKNVYVWILDFAKCSGGY